MSRFFPKSLFGQTLLVLLVGLIISHAAGSWIYSLDREQAVRAVGGFAVAQRITNLARLVQETPRESRPRIVAALSDQTFRVALSAQPPAMTSVDDDSEVADAIKAFLVDQLSLGSAQQPRVAASRPAGTVFEGLHPMMGAGPMMRGFGAFGPFGGFRDLQVVVPLSDGQWLSFATALPQSGPAFSRQFLLSMGFMAAIILAVSVWVVRRVTAPLASLSAAAERLGNDLNAPPMPETGTVETRNASRAFNTMQTRLRGLIENRTRMFVAISHDLRTPLTLLRLRAENVEDPAEREKMQATIAEMDSMVAATLQFARDEATAEPRRRTDLTALLASVVDDMADIGLPVTLEPAQPIVCECQPGPLKRALTNLLDNAVKYGKRAHGAIHSKLEMVEITIDDKGPGIPEDELARVFQPFYRVEGSRSRETGGIGLGLAIALSVVQAHGGQLTLSNRPEGGLRATIILPVESSRNACAPYDCNHMKIVDPSDKDFFTKGHTMPRSLLLATTVALSAIATVATAQTASMPGSQHHAPMLRADLREQLQFPPEMEVNFFGNMRDHMQTLDGILQAVAEGDFAGASRIASERLGLDSPSAAACKPGIDSGASKGAMTKPSNASAPLSMDEMMARYMPDPMRAIGLSMHTAASNFAVVAAQSAASHDTTATLAALSKVTQNCVACHAAYRLR